MKIDFMKYPTQDKFSEQYEQVRRFLVSLKYAEFTYTRWDWMVTHSYLDQEAIGNVGLWLCDQEVVGLSVFDVTLGTAFCLNAKGFEALRPEMIAHAERYFSKDGKLYIVIPDADLPYQKTVTSLGYCATPHKESDAIFYIDETSMDYELPEGFKVTTLAETYDLKAYSEVLWKGFNHELNGEGPLVYTEKEHAENELSMIRPNVDLDLKVAILNDKNEFVSYCGMWFDEESGYAVVEPVATAPEYRKLGLGKAAVLEGIKRVADRGAKKVLVGSTQQFYYSIGFYPFKTSSLWMKTIESKG